MNGNVPNIITINKDRNYHRYMYIDGEEVAHVAVIDFTVRFGGANVRMAGIGDVRTALKHRNKGYMRRLMNDTVEYMKDRNYPVSMLIGTPDFYHKFGYRVCFSIPFLSVQLDEIKMMNEGMRIHIRPVLSSDFPTIVRLYNTNNSCRTGSLVRSERYFKSFFRGSALFSTTESFIVESDHGEIIGYVVYDKHYKEMNIVEVEVSDHKYYPAITRKLVQIAKEKFGITDTLKDGKKIDNQVISVYMPTDHSFIQYMKRFGGDIKDHYPRNGMGMMRINRLPELFNALLTELSARSHLVCQPDEPEKNLLIKTDIGTIGISVKFGCVSISDKTKDGCLFELSQDKLIQLLMGYRSVEDLLIDPLENVVCENKKLASLLYSPSPAYIWSADLF